MFRSGTNQVLVERMDKRWGAATLDWFGLPSDAGIAHALDSLDLGRQADPFARAPRLQNRRIPRLRMV